MCINALHRLFSENELWISYTDSEGMENVFKLKWEA